ncbi:MAG: UDP-diphosphatase [Candidatus Omnitrophica bacterium CG11_big_fil_rev_8_21_14_0_20_63_9]|nr:MAG: UDP-diphosphatase [Candidatus Omnitrophica bacterium CG11_big_fil_rev_8_21_14_0_20_63_9]
MIEPGHALILGAVEGLTEFLPVSSTGHLILAAHWLGLEGEAVKTFEVVIQAGALGAVLALYRRSVASMWRGLRGQDADGRRLLINLFVSFLPAAIVGLALHKAIKATLFSLGPVIAALALGGVVMIGIDRWLRSRARPARELASLTIRDALLIGLAQCLSLWPGTSRAMVTLVAGLLVGLPATAAAEYSFLLALPTLGAATMFDAVRGGGELLDHAGGLSVACGFAMAAVVAALAITGLVRYLTRRGLAPFGWYRLAMALVVWLLIGRSGG